MTTEEIINNFIKNEREGEYLDFKAKPYKDREALIKDIMAMANSKHEGNKYIIVGIKDNINGNREIVGLKEVELVDQASYQQLIISNIEPDIFIKFYPFQYKDKLLGIFELFENNNPPYILKKDFNKLKKGFCLIRKGSQQCPATRSDFDAFFKNKGEFEIHVLQPCFLATNVKEGCGFLEMSIRNITDVPITVAWGELKILDRDFNILSTHPLFGVDNVVGADFKVHLPPKTEKAGFFYFGFTSTDCLRLNLDEYGTTEQAFRFKIALGDTLKNEYTKEIDIGYVSAKGEFLWKVIQKKKDEDRLMRHKNRLAYLFKKRP